MTSESWAGFSDEDIQRIKSSSKVPKTCTEKICDIDGFTSKNRGPMKIKSTSLKLLKSEQLSETYECNSTYSEDKNEQLPSSLHKEASAFKKMSLDDSLTRNDDNCMCNNVCNQNGIEPSIDDTMQTELYQERIEEICDEDVQSNINLPSLEIFEIRQKRIEAENARRRALISKAINDKKKRTHAEAIKLAKITEELNRIDSNLSADISILRDYIEKASLEFSEAEKRYLKAEKEFVEAKLILFEKMQRKEMLTEHLCAIIEQNENRKADKLVELMKQLEMEVIMEDFEVNGIQPILPNLCVLSDESDHSCQTLKPSLCKENSHEQISSEFTESPDLGEKTVLDSSQEIPSDDSFNTSKSESNTSADNTEDLEA